MKKETENVIKGRIGESIAEEMFKELGFFVMKLGKEHTVNPLTQLQDFINSCGGSFSLEKLGYEIKEITHVNVLPDFLIVHSNGKSALLEVKFRWNGKLFPNDDFLYKTYPEAHMLIISLEIDEESKESKRANFYVWNKQNLENKNDMSLKSSTLNEWLKDKFDLKNDEILEKYRGYTKRWLGNAEVFRKEETSK